jgi:hypothetical protein
MACACVACVLRVNVCFALQGNMPAAKKQIEDGNNNKK